MKGSHGIETRNRVLNMVCRTGLSYITLGVIHGEEFSWFWGFNGILHEQGLDYKKVAFVQF